MKLITNLLISLSFLLFSSCFAGTVDINSADAATLAKQINGIGKSKAQAIVDYRDQYGPFKSVDDLVLVRGIGAKTVIKNKDNLSVSQEMSE
jgi:competence protein ComEA